MSLSKRRLVRKHQIICFLLCWPHRYYIDTFDRFTSKISLFNLIDFVPESSPLFSAIRAIQIFGLSTKFMERSTRGLNVLMATFSGFCGLVNSKIFHPEQRIPQFISSTSAMKVWRQNLNADFWREIQIGSICRPIFFDFSCWWVVTRSNRLLIASASSSRSAEWMDWPEIESRDPLRGPLIRCRAGADDPIDAFYAPSLISSSISFFFLTLRNEESRPLSETFSRNLLFRSADVSTKCSPIQTRVVCSHPTEVASCKFIYKWIASINVNVTWLS